MAKISLAEKLEFVNLWRSSGLTQDEFAETYLNVSARSLREWVRLTKRPPEALAHVRSVVAGAVADLQSLLASLDAANEEHDVRLEPEPVVRHVEESAPRQEEAPIPLAPREVTLPPARSPPARLPWPAAHYWSE